jgi:hypothetical protein
VANEVNFFSYSFVAAADLSAKQFYAVAIDSAGKVNVAGAGVPVAGVLTNKPTSGQEASVAILGISKAVAGGTIAAGALVEANASGQFITISALVQASGAAGMACGICLTPTTVSGDIFTLLLLPMGVKPTSAA